MDPCSSETPDTDASRSRRVVALVLPALLCELASATLAVPRPRPAGSSSTGAGRAPAARGRAAPLAVLLVDDASPSKEHKEKDGEPDAPKAAPATSVLAAVNDAAAHFGVRVGQTVAEAHAFIAQLTVREISREQVQARLGEIAEVALGFGPTVAIEAPDTVWVDVTGAAHLAGGEDALALEIGARVRALGHAVRVAVSDGPRLAQAFARWGRLSREGTLVVAPSETAIRVAGLPVRALPVDASLSEWLVRLGVLTFGDVSRLPRAATAARLGEDAGRILDLAEGKDDSPLVAYVPPAIPREETTWEEPADGAEPLLFVLRGLVSRLGARLEGRGEAVQALDLLVLHDRSIARLQGAEPSTLLRFELSTPLWRAEELFRVIASRLGRTELPAPSIGLRLSARAITRALSLQLHLSRYAAGLGGSAARGPETLPVLLAELLSDLGKDRVGVLRVEGAHRPEKKSRLTPVTPTMLAPSRGARPAVPLLPEPAAGRFATPARLLSHPVPFDAPLRPGATVSVDSRFYSIDRVAFERRLCDVEWWTENPVSRDYVRVWLKSASFGLEAIVYVDRTTGARKLQALCD